MANAYKKFRVYEKDKTTGVTHGLTVEGVHILESMHPPPIPLKRGLASALID